MPVPGLRGLASTFDADGQSDEAVPGDASFRVCLSLRQGVVLWSDFAITKGLTGGLLDDICLCLR